MRTPVRSTWWALRPCLLILAAVSTVASGQTQTRVSVPGRGSGSFNVSVDYTRIKELTSDLVSGPLVDITARSLNLELDYGLTDRLALTVGLPLRSNRAVSFGFQHDPSLLPDDHGDPFLDDGAYHTYWADLGIGVRWQWRATERVALTPFVSYYTPSNDYPIYALAQPGKGQQRLDVGLNAAGRLGSRRPNLYWRAGYAYSYSEKARPADAATRRVDHSRLTLETGWRATPLISPYLILTKTWSHNGLPILGFDALFVTDQWYYHDWLFPWEQTTWTIGTSYQLSDQTGLSFAYASSQDVEFGFFQDPTVSIGFTYGFGAGNRVRER